MTNESLIKFINDICEHPEHGLTRTETGDADEIKQFY